MTLAELQQALDEEMARDLPEEIAPAPRAPVCVCDESPEDCSACVEPSETRWQLGPGRPCATPNCHRLEGDCPHWPNRWVEEPSGY